MDNYSQDHSVSSAPTGYAPNPAACSTRSLTARAIKEMLGSQPSPTLDHMIQSGSSVVISPVDSVTEADRLLLSLERRTNHSDTWPFFEWVEYGMMEPDVEMIAVRPNGHVDNLGFAVFSIQANAQTAVFSTRTLSLDVEIHRLYVSDSDRRRGLGLGLVAAIVADVGRILANHVNSLSGINRINVHLLGDSFSPEAARLFDICHQAIADRCDGLIPSGKHVDVNCVSMVNLFVGSEDD